MKSIALELDQKFERCTQCTLYTTLIRRSVGGAWVSPPTAMKGMIFLTPLTNIHMSTNVLNKNCNFYCSKNANKNFETFQMKLFVIIGIRKNEPFLEVRGHALYMF